MDDGWNLGNGRLGPRATAYSKRSKLPSRALDLMRSSKRSARPPPERMPIAQRPARSLAGVWFVSYAMSRRGLGNQIDTDREQLTALALPRASSSPASGLSHEFPSGSSHLPPPASAPVYTRRNMYIPYIHLLPATPRDGES